ncbi:helix-turn-helix transcriptional regulator [Oscillatoria sp. FACHB-1407]|uniref:winged helix-turn-helix transcriptional regulator n=1 Tax=Oscillatoria sp. FACHB-1407 TaxID=2692847 RepID=UPI001685AC45|nr:helix-turn-helix domain-containing protein [Oscillatoria sp. FACHB-1407]MBD2463473.1 helix-turn-helix transcriptional regulator [Oscillatoria sp. FACHB-1407]
MVSKTNSDATQLNYLPQPALDRIANMNLFDTNCAGHQMLEHIANKWTVLIVYALTQGKKRYSELKQQIVGVSPKMLIQNLRNLERCGLIQREIYPTVPPRVDYSLTTLGESLVEPLAILGEWAYRHIPEVKAAMEQYDENPKENYWEPK